MVKKPSQQHPQVCPEELCKNKLCQSRWQVGGNCGNKLNSCCIKCPMCQGGAKSSNQLKLDLDSEDFRLGEGANGRGPSGHSRGSDLCNPGPVWWGACRDAQDGLSRSCPQGSPWQEWGDGQRFSEPWPSSSSNLRRNTRGLAMNWTPFTGSRALRAWHLLKGYPVALC